MRRLASERCRRLGVDPATPGAIVELERRPLVRQSHRLTASTAAVVADMVLWRWDRPTLEALADLLAPEAVLVFVEPTAELGWRRVVHRVTAQPTRLVRRRHFNADVPANLRTSGLVVTTLDRFSLGPAGLGSYAWGQAERITAQSPPIQAD